MGTLQEIALTVLFAILCASFIAAFIKGSRPPQPLQKEPPVNSRAFANALLATLSPGVSILVFYLGVWTKSTNNRIFDALIALPLAYGAYGAFRGRRAFRSKGAHVSVRVVGLLAVIVCVPSAVLFLVITIFGVG